MWKLKLSEHSDSMHHTRTYVTITPASLIVAVPFDLTRCDARLLHVSVAALS